MSSSSSNPSQQQSSHQPQAWTPDEDAPACQTCANKFTLLTRRHHCRLCGQVVCGDCSRIRACLPQKFPELGSSSVRLCLECVCDLTCENEGVNIAPIMDFVHAQLRGGVTAEEKQRAKEKMELQVKLQLIQTKMRLQERKLFEEEDLPVIRIAWPTQDLAAKVTNRNDAQDEIGVETSSALSVPSNSHNNSSTRPSPSSSPLLSASIPSSPSSPPFIQMMKGYASQIQSLQSALSDLQMRDGLLVQVILQNINSAANNEVWNNQHSNLNNTTQSSPHPNESNLNTGLYRYLLILPPPHRLICITSLVYPPTPSVFKKAVHANGASIAIQNQLSSLNLPPHLLDAPIEAAREFFNVFSTHKSQPVTPNPPASPTEEIYRENENEPEKKEHSDEDKTIVANATTDTATATTIANPSSDDSATSSSSTLNVTVASPPSLTTTESPVADPVLTTVPTAPTPMSHTQSAKAATSSSAHPTSKSNKLRFYGIRGLDAISSIRPLDFRSNQANSNGSVVQRGFTINFHQHAAPTPSSLMDSITNRRDEDVLGLYKQSWNCIIVDDQLKSVQTKFQQALNAALKEEGLEPTPSSSPPPSEPMRKASSTSKRPTPAASPVLTATSSTEVVAPLPVKLEPPATTSVSSKPTGDRSSPSLASAPSPSPSPASSFFSSIMSVFAPQRNAATTEPSSAGRRKSATQQVVQSGPPSTAQLAAIAQAELAYNVQQDVITSIHSCSVAYYALLIEQEKNHVKQWMADMKTAVKWETEAHHSLLERLWASYSTILTSSSNLTNTNSPSKNNSASPTNPADMIAPPFPGEASEDWKLLGFQGTNPCTDFRGVGLLSLKVLVYIGENYRPLVEVLMSLQSASLMKPREYPLACAGINLICAIVNLLELNAPGPNSASSSSSSNSQVSNNSIVVGSNSSTQKDLQGPTTALLNNIKENLSNVTAKLLNKESDAGAVILTPHQDQMSSLWARLVKNRLFRLFVRHKSRLGIKTTESAGMTTPKKGATPAATKFEPASLDYLNTIDSMGELLVILFPILDTLWVEEGAGYFQFNSILRQVISALEYVLLKKNPHDFRHLEVEMKKFLRHERQEREKQQALQQALIEKQRVEANKKHHPHTHTNTNHQRSKPTTPIAPVPIAQPIVPTASMDHSTTAVDDANSNPSSTTSTIESSSSVPSTDVTLSNGDAGESTTVSEPSPAAASSSQPTTSLPTDTTTSTTPINPPPSLPPKLRHGSIVAPKTSTAIDNPNSL